MRRMTTNHMPRFEYRVWGRALDDVAAQVRSGSECVEVKESTDTYLVPHSFAGANPKLRAGSLDVKILLTVDDGFQRWVPQLKGEFPLDDRWIRERFFPLIGVSPSRIVSGSYPMETFLTEVIAPTDGLSTVTVHKRRLFYEVNGCTAEIAEIGIGGTSTLTVAIESSDLEALRAARAFTGVGRLPNLSYAQAIPLLLGWDSATPADRASVGNG
jgi:exopolyphosphatase/guanosine-5'-triphosphate,3'-diphosphate pyrophosphatase